MVEAAVESEAAEVAGVPAEEAARLFEPFERGAASAPSPGLGVGLSLVARFAEAHGGRAWVEDRDGGGASFRVLFPDPTRAASRSVRSRRP